MERAIHPPKEHEAAHPAPHLAPTARDPDLPAVSDTTLMMFAGATLVATVLSLFFLVD